MSERCKTDHVPREVIGRKLLSALDDESKVAILASKEDVEMLIEALERTASQSAINTQVKMREFATDLKQLVRQAFP